MCNNTKENFLWEPGKINIKFLKNYEKIGNVEKILTAKCHFAKFDIFCLSGSHKKFSFGVITDN